MDNKSVADHLFPGADKAAVFIVCRLIVISDAEMGGDFFQKFRFDFSIDLFPANAGVSGCGHSAPAVDMGSGHRWNLGLDRCGGGDSGCYDGYFPCGEQKTI